MFRDSKYSLWHANAGRAAQPEPGHQGPDVGPPRLQHPRERHRLPDRVRLHRPHDAGPAAGLEPLRGPGGAGHELRGRAVRRHAVRRDVRGRLLRDRPAPRGRGGAEGDPGRQRLRAAHPRRAGLARARTRRTGARPGTGSRRSGTGATSARTGRSSRSTSTPASTGPTSCSASCTATGTSRRRWRSRPAPGRTPTATRRAPRGSSASCSATSGSRRSGRRASRRSRTRSSSSRATRTTRS